MTIIGIFRRRCSNLPKGNGVKSRRDWQQSSTRKRPKRLQPNITVALTVEVSGGALPQIECYRKIGRQYPSHTRYCLACSYISFLAIFHWAGVAVHSPDATFSQMFVSTMGNPIARREAYSLGSSPWRSILPQNCTS